MPSESLDRNLDRFYQQNPSFLEQNQPLLVEFKDEPNYFGDIIGWLAPIMLLLFFWLFMMRRMGGGGGGGQIFNIGKSKAKLFDANAEIKTTFKDVAGLRRRQGRSTGSRRLP